MFERRMYWWTQKSPMTLTYYSQLFSACYWCGSEWNIRSENGDTLSEIAIKNNTTIESLSNESNQQSHAGHHWSWVNVQTHWSTKWILLAVREPESKLTNEWRLKQQQLLLMLLIMQHQLLQIWNGICTCTVILLEKSDHMQMAEMTGVPASTLGATSCSRIKRSSERSKSISELVVFSNNASVQLLRWWSNPISL